MFTFQKYLVSVCFARNLHDSTVPEHHWNGWPLLLSWWIWTKVQKIKIPTVDLWFLGMPKQTRNKKKSRKRKKLGACTQANQDGSHPFLYAQSAGFSALRYCFHNGSCTLCRIGGLEDATAHEDTINPQLHAQGGIGWSGHAASGEVNHGKLAWNLPQWTTSTSKH